MFDISAKLPTISDVELVEGDEVGGGLLLALMVKVHKMTHARKFSPKTRGVAQMCIYVKKHKRLHFNTDVCELPCRIIFPV